MHVTKEKALRYSQLIAEDKHLWPDDYDDDVVTLNWVVGRNLKWLRQREGLTCNDLAKILHYWDINSWHASKVSRLENDKQVFTLPQIAFLARVFRVALTWLLEPHPFDDGAVTEKTSVLIGEHTTSIQTYTLDLYTDPRQNSVINFDFYEHSVPKRKRREIVDIYDQIEALGPRAGLAEVLELIETEEEHLMKIWEEGNWEAQPHGEHSED
jgi:transcriptional regulator with XRE-family HTH domain